MGFLETFATGGIGSAAGVAERVSADERSTPILIDLILSYTQPVFIVIFRFFCPTMSLVVLSNPAHCWGLSRGLTMGNLTALKVKNAKPGRYGDGENLYLQVEPSLAKKWLLRFRLHGKDREMGLGSASVVSLSEARERAATARRMIANGIDPIDDRRKSGRVPTFGAFAEEVIAAREQGFRNPKHRQQWRNTLRTYAVSIWDKPVNAVTTDHIQSILAPIWLTKAETASRVRGRLQKILDAAKSRGYREGDNPAGLKGNLDHLLPDQSTVVRHHHAAMDYHKVPAFCRRLESVGGIAAIALRFCILTAARTEEVRGAVWSEINWDNKTWDRPAERMKTKQFHQVTLSEQALEILNHRRAGQINKYVFPGSKTDRPISSLETPLDRLKVTDATVHGFRSSFRDWVGDETEYPSDLAELCLSHILGNKTERAYRRTAAVERRRQLMQDWADYCDLPSNT